MRFSVYVRRFGELHRLFKIHRSAKGLYVLSEDKTTYSSYHEDGKYWMRVAGRKIIKKLREPLSTFTGVETLGIYVIVIDEGSSKALDPASVHLKPDDVVLDHSGLVVVEIMISDRCLQLPPLPNRLGALTFTKSGNPLLIIETFTALGNAIPAPRFHRVPQAIYHSDMPARI